MFNNYAKSELELMVGKDEKIFWKGKPNKRCYILEGIFNPLLPFAIIWFLFDSFFIASFVGTSIAAGAPTIFSIVPLIFFALHMMPVWLYIGGVLFVLRSYQHTEYIVTDKGVYVSGGLFSYTCYMKPFTELSRVNIHRGIIDQIIGVGDVVLTSGLGQSTPQGIYIGTVEKIESDKYNLSKNVYIKTYQDFNDIHYVTVLRTK